MRCYIISGEASQRKFAKAWRDSYFQLYLLCFFQSSMIIYLGFQQLSWVRALAVWRSPFQVSYRMSPNLDLSYDFLMLILGLQPYFKDLIIQKHCVIKPTLELLSMVSSESTIAPMVAWAQILDGMNNGWCQRSHVCYLWMSELPCLCLGFHT